jgi:hypothetical protein
LQTRKRERCGAFGVYPAIPVAARSSKRCANGANERVAAKAIKSNRSSPGPQHGVDRGQGSQIGWRPRLRRHGYLPSIATSASNRALF